MIVERAQKRHLVDVFKQEGFEVLTEDDVAILAKEVRSRLERVREVLEEPVNDK